MSSDEFDKCITCKVEVKNEDQALQCDLCEGWEHIHCIKMCDIPSQACYEALMQTPCKALLFTCSWCKRKGSYPIAPGDFFWAHFDFETYGKQK